MIQIFNIALGVAIYAISLWVVSKIKKRYRVKKKLKENNHIIEFI